ncbi:hypothetical protein IJF86_02200 [Candidatus Saccharibacteria bacterium]|nr:hypothetical protein [Candidatus Saccharibacteria bacterium]
MFLKKSFIFKNYAFDPKSLTATFSYQGPRGTTFTEKIEFEQAAEKYDQDLLERALFLSFILIGTSYYKADPTKTVKLDTPLDSFQSNFFNKVYQEGLSQFAFENRLTRNHLAHFKPKTNFQPVAPKPYPGTGILSLQSGGKDSLLTATLLAEQSKSFTPWYLSANGTHPTVLDNLGQPLLTATRSLDLEHLRSAKFNGHVPVTYINQSLALVQAILLGKSTILTSIGQEGNEPHAKIGDLAVNHQWSKTWEAEQLFSQYVHTYISEDIQIGSPLRQFSELKIAQLFAEKCWKKYQKSFSSCNVANYRQTTDTKTLSWCGECAKCANTFLLFAPFLEKSQLASIFGGKDLFADESLVDIFKGLLGIDGKLKPFECVGEIAELRKAYHKKLPGYTDLPFSVPDSNFDLEETHPSQIFNL